MKLQILIWLRRKRVTFTKPCACAAKCITFLAWHTTFMQITMECGANWHATRPWKVTFWSSPQRQGHRSRIRTLADGCERLRTVANTKTTTGEHSSTLRLPKLNENPSLRIREKAPLPRKPQPDPQHLHPFQHWTDGQTFLAPTLPPPAPAIDPNASLMHLLLDCLNHLPAAAVAVAQWSPKNAPLPHKLTPAPLH